MFAPFEVKGEHIQYYNTKNLRRVYDYQIFRVIILGMHKQSVPGLLSLRGRPGVEAGKEHALKMPY